MIFLTEDILALFLNASSTLPNSEIQVSFTPKFGYSIPDLSDDVSLLVAFLFESNSLHVC